MLAREEETQRQIVQSNRSESDKEFCRGRLICRGNECGRKCVNIPPCLCVARALSILISVAPEEEGEKVCCEADARTSVCVNGKGD